MKEKVLVVMFAGGKEVKEEGHGKLRRGDLCVSK